MDVPILVATISVTGTLLGAVLGSTIATFSNFAVSRRRERLDFRTGCRLVQSELSANEALLKAHLETKTWWGDRFELGTSEWIQYKSVLATHLPTDDWHKIRLAALAVSIIDGMASTPSMKEAISDDEAQGLRYQLHGIEAGNRAVSGYT
jgi:hypothetical protein